jgi:hypothetical protein
MVQAASILTDMQKFPLEEKVLMEGVVNELYQLQLRLSNDRD